VLAATLYRHVADKDELVREVPSASPANGRRQPPRR
jgi:hypothetical protein